jgi:acyl-[acyl-carrier-protein]-phospholipid O-acyltransferase / long-chain-fatty-acid--[acyl-carrier-protein] ligase
MELAAPERMTTSDTPTERPWKLGFWSLIVTQFFGAFNDNVLRQLVTFVILGTPAIAAREWGVPAVSALFSLPFILFSMIGGYLADRHSKRTITISVKVFEIAIMLLVLVGLARGHLTTLLAGIFLMGTHSAFFGPSKYGLLPELLPQKRLSWGNGIIEMGTMAAIISGIAMAGVLYTKFRPQPGVPGFIMLGLAVVGLVASLGIGRVPAANPERRLRLNYAGEIAEQWRIIRPDRVLVLAILGNTYFWFIGVLLQQNVIVLGKDVLQVSEVQISYLLAALAIGTGLGSLAAGRLSGQKIEYGLIPLGSLGLMASSFALATPGLPYVWVLTDLALLGFSGGFFFVPLMALIQHRPDETRKGGVIAFSNLLSFVGMFIASGVYYVATAKLDLTPEALFLGTSIVTLGGTIYVLMILPDALIRLVLWLLTHTFYRIRVVGRDNIPAKGGALFVCNHLSFVDVLLLIASTDRFIRFVMHQDFYRLPWLRPFARIMRAIPISSAMRPRELIGALRSAGEAVREGDVVCIFAEGQISRIGLLLPFARGFEKIMKGVSAPIIPVALDNVWGSIFSFSRRRFLWKLPERPLEPITVSYGQALASTAKAFDARQAVQELLADAWSYRRAQMRPLGRAFIRSARRRPWRMAMVDVRTPALGLGTALMRTIYLARRLRPHWSGQDKVGILLPPTVAGALVNYAALLMGKVPVNLNYTASSETLASCARQCGLKTVVTSQAFLDKVKLTVPGETLLIEQIAVRPRASEKLLALLMAWTFPAPLLERAVGRQRKVQIDDLATVIFSSGSTGDPKGVMLSHFNLVANVTQLGQTFALNRHDRIVGILPFFHSFGFTATLALPMVLGVGVVFHFTPLDPRAIGALVAEHGATFLLSTPTFLQTYLRRTPPEAFGSLAFVMVGAEKLPERVATAFEERFGIRPLEGYGCTECAPAVTVNTRDFRAAGFRQIGAKRGTIGQPLPGISVRIVDLETRQPLPPGRAGLLVVRGPNVMLGYLGREDKTAEVLQGGWYMTGDVALVDEDGFVQITDRLSRFSKIGGEMVPHVKVEDVLHDLAGATEQCFAVTGLPDERKGERLVVLHTLPDERLAPCLERLPNAGLPNLWTPRTKDFHRIEALPYLGTGKLDLRRLRELAQSATIL